jgi:hypothetical protein
VAHPVIYALYAVPYIIAVTQASNIENQACAPRHLLKAHLRVCILCSLATEDWVPSLWRAGLQDFPSFDVRQKDVVFVYENTHLEHFSAKVAPGSYFLRRCVHSILSFRRPFGAPGGHLELQTTIWSSRRPF